MTDLTPDSLTLGINYWASHAATRMWSDWSAEIVERDLAALAGLGVSLLRVFPIWSDFQPVMTIRSNCFPGGYPYSYAFTGEKPLPDTEAGRAGVDETMLERFQTLADLAAAAGMKLIVPILNGHMTFRLYLPPAVDGLDAFTDPTSLMWQVRFIRVFVNRFKHHPALLAWEIGNEANCLSRTEQREVAWSWTSRITDAIRACDPDHPICSGMHHLYLHDNQWKKSPAESWLLADQAENCDLLSTHPYAMWRSYVNLDPVNTLRWIQLPSAENRLYEDVGGKPCFVEEIGTLRRTFSDFTALGRQYNATLWSLWANGGRGALWWCAFDQKEMEFPPYDWDNPGMEHGILQCDYTQNPTGEAIASFARFQKTAPVSALPERRRRAVCLFGRDQNHEELATAMMILTAQANCAPRFAFTGQALPEGELYLLPSFHRKGGLNRAAWRELLGRVEEGATLYLSGDYDANLTEMPEVVGCEIVSRRKNTAGVRTVTLTLDGESVVLRLAPDHHAVPVSRGARQLDDAGWFWEFPRGKGRVVFTPVPLEKILLAEPGSFQSQPVWKFYRYLAAKVLRDEVIGSEDPEILVSEHPENDNRLYAVAVSNTPEERCLQLRPAPGWQLESVASNDPGVHCEAGSLNLPGNAGALLMLIRK